MKLNDDSLAFLTTFDKPFEIIVLGPLVEDLHADTYITADPVLS